jgi:hypothetical protein
MTTEERLGRIDERLEHLEHELLGNGQPGAIQKHDDAIASLERWQSYIKGALAILAVLISAGWVAPILATVLRK